MIGRLSGYQYRLLRKIAMATEGCPRRLWFPAVYLPIKRRNLLYHVYPDPANDIWRCNVTKCVEHWTVFNGRKLVVIATGPGLLDPSTVQDAFDRSDAEYLLVPNDAKLREVAGFKRLIAEVASTSSREASFFAHTKGNTTEGHREGVARWRNVMYSHLLGKADACMEHLKRYAAVGTTKMTFQRPGGFRYPSGLHHGLWMFAGTFFWFRHDVIFSGPHEVPHDRYGAEAWLGGLLPVEQGFSIFQPWPERQHPPNSPYAPEHYPEDFDDERPD